MDLNSNIMEHDYENSSKPTLVFLEERIDYLEKLVKKYKFCSLTGLMKELDFDEELHKLFEESKITNEKFILVIADVDNLHNVNKLKGWKAGNALISSVAEQLKERFAKHQLFRLGGDEYCVLIRESTKTYDEVCKLVDSITNITYNASLFADEDTASEFFKKCDEELNKKKLARKDLKSRV